MIESYVDSLIYKKPIIWTNMSTGEKGIATTEQTLFDIQDCILFIRMELEND